MKKFLFMAITHKDVTFHKLDADDYDDAMVEGEAIARDLGSNPVNMNIYGFVLSKKNAEDIVTDLNELLQDTE